MKQPQQQHSAPAAAAPSAPGEPGMADQLLNDIVGQTPPRPQRADGIAVGIFEALSDDGQALVSIAAFGLSRIPARTITPLDPGQIGRPLALAFEGGDPLKPIVLGLMLGPAAAASQPEHGADTETDDPEESGEDDLDVIVDGERIVLTAEREIEFRCGEAAIVLSADGRIQLRGTYITSHASATQRILGGSVNIN